MHTSHDQGFYEIHFTLFSAIRSKNPETRVRRGSHPCGPLIPLLSIRRTLSRTPTKQTLTSRKFCIQVPHKSVGRSLERTFFPRLRHCGNVIRAPPGPIDLPKFSTSADWTSAIRDLLREYRDETRSLHRSLQRRELFTIRSKFPALDETRNC